VSYYICHVDNVFYLGYIQNNLFLSNFKLGTKEHRHKFFEGWELYLNPITLDVKEDLRLLIKNTEWYPIEVLPIEELIKIRILDNMNNLSYAYDNNPYDMSYKSFESVVKKVEDFNYILNILNYFMPDPYTGVYYVKSINVYKDFITTPYTFWMGTVPPSHMEVPNKTNMSIDFGCIKGLYTFENLLSRLCDRSFSFAKFLSLNMKEGIKF